ncbi:MAG: tetratricopeptide repeat protein [Myxococcota bacterium]
MVRAKEAAEAEELLPEEYLRRALRASSPSLRMDLARTGLAQPSDDLDPDTHVLLLRQVYLGHLELRQLGEAVAVADQMTAVGTLRDVALHDSARALWAMGDLQGAIEAQRLAARAAPPERRSFHLWSLATLQHFAGDAGGALDTLARGGRWATRDRPLLEAHAAYVRLEQGHPVERLSEILDALKASRAAEGYGRYLLGMIAHHMGDARTAAVHLRAFLNRHASADVAQALTLREELRRARLVLARVESS